MPMTPVHQSVGTSQYEKLWYGLELNCAIGVPQDHVVFDGKYRQA